MKYCVHDLYCSWQAEKDIPHEDVRLVATIPPDIQFHVNDEVEVVHTHLDASCIYCQLLMSYL